MKWLLQKLDEMPIIKETWLQYPVTLLLLTLMVARSVVTIATIGTVDHIIGLVAILAGFKEPAWVGKVRPWIYGEFGSMFMNEWGKK